MYISADSCVVYGFLNKRSVLNTCDSTPHTRPYFSPETHTAAAASSCVLCQYTVAFVVANLEGTENGVRQRDRETMGVVVVVVVRTKKRKEYIEAMLTSNEIRLLCGVGVHAINRHLVPGHGSVTRLPQGTMRSGMCTSEAR